MPDWGLFASFVLLAAAAFVLLARASARTLREPAFGVPAEPGRGGEESDTVPPGPAGSPFASTRLLVANVLATHGVLAVALLAAAWYARVPVAALGVDPSVSSVGVGLALGAALAAANEAGARLTGRLGVGHDERLRELLAPESPAGWAGLLLVVLPVVALAEELLFRGALVGALSAGLGWPVPALVVGSSALFGLGHGLQGPGGVVVTAALGTALAVAFVLTGSLLVVVVAHYVVNAAEFVVNEGPL